MKKTCTPFFKKNFLILFLVLVAAGISAQPVCNAHFVHYSMSNPDSVHFYPTGNNATGAQYYWSFGDGSNSTTFNPWHFYASAGAYVVCLTVTDTANNTSCTDTWCDTIYVNVPHCNAHFTYTVSTHNIDSLSFVPTTTYNTGNRYSWTFGDGGTSPNFDPSHVYLSAGTYTVCLTVTDSTSNGNCTDTWCDTVRVSAPPPPVCNAHFSHYSMNNPDSVHFYSTGGNATGTQYSWSFGDGTFGTGIYPWHLYATTGTYYVCLTVTDSTQSGTCMDTWCDSVNVSLPPPPVCNAQFTHYSSNTNVDSIHFSASGNNATGSQYYWTFGDGTTGTTIDPWHYYASAGTYYVCLTVTDSTASGTCTATWCDSVHVTIPPPPVCNAHFSHYTIHNPDSVHFYSTGGNATGTQYSWSFGDGTFGTGIYPWHLYATTGTYYVCLTVTDSTQSGTCTDTWCDSVNVSLPPPPVCNAQFTHYSSNTNVDSIHFSASGNNATGSQYYWTFGDGTTGTTIDPWHYYASTGTYYVCLTVTDSTASGTCTATWCDSIHVTTPPPPVCNAHFSHYTIHNPDSVHFYSTGGNATGTQYSWSFGDGTFGSGQYPWHFYSTTGTYYVCLTVTDSTQSGTCSDTWCDSVNVSLPPPPVCNAQFTHYSLTSNVDSVHFNASGNNATGSQYYWTFGDGTTGTTMDPWHYYASAGTYYVCLTVTDSTASGTCTATWCDSIHVTTPPPPVCNAQFYHYTVTNNQDSVHFYPTGNNGTGTQYYWSFGDGTRSTNFDPWHYFSSGSYTVCLTVIDSNSNGSCTATWCDTISAPIPPPHHSNANVFVYANPSNRLVTVTLQNIVNPVTIRIFDNLGHQLFRQDNMVDGSYNLVNMDTRRGVYFYQADDGSQSVSHGKVMVVQ